MEEFLYEKLDKKVPTRANNHELLGECMIDSGHEFGPGTAYGKLLTVSASFWGYVHEIVATSQKAHFFRQAAFYRSVNHQFVNVCYL